MGGQRADALLGCGGGRWTTWRWPHRTRARSCFDPYAGTVSFGDGRRGRVPAPGDRTVCVRCVSGGGARGNVPAGRVNALVGALPRISGVVNITPMGGGTDRFPQERIEAVGNKRLRYRGRAAGASDFEELVLEAFPAGAACEMLFRTGRKGHPRARHVTVVVTGVDDGPAADRRATASMPSLRSGSCCLTAEGRLHVCPATVITVSTRIAVELEEIDCAAEIQRGDHSPDRNADRRYRGSAGSAARSARTSCGVWYAIRRACIRSTGYWPRALLTRTGRARLVPLEHDAISRMQ